MTGLKNCVSNRKWIPLHWIKTFFRKISNIRAIDIEYFNNFIQGTLDIIGSCSFKLPRRSKWEGHPYYFEVLSSIQKIVTELPKDVNDLLSTPLWFNKFLGTTFDCTLSKLGFNIFKDIMPEGKILTLNSINNLNISKQKQNILLKISQSIPSYSKKIIEENSLLYSIAFPRTSFQREDSVFYINCNDKNTSRNTYNNLISRKSKLPVGMHKWCLKFDLSTERIKNAFIFAKKCMLSIKSIALQYKISTNTLPTGEYLWNYNVKDNFYCSRCIESSNDLTVRDNINHSLYSCPNLNLFLSKIFSFLIQECKAAVNISELDYLLGFMDKFALNSVLLELKKFIFYSYNHNSNIDVQFSMFIKRLRRLILLEKSHYFSVNKIDYFYKKWEQFSEVYMFHGPDPIL